MCVCVCVCGCVEEGGAKLRNIKMMLALRVKECVCVDVQIGVCVRACVGVADVHM